MDTNVFADDGGDNQTLIGKAQLHCVSVDVGDVGGSGSV